MVIELKRENGGRASRIQVYRLGEWRRAGAVAGVAETRGEVEDILSEIQKSVDNLFSE